MAKEGISFDRTGPPDSNDMRRVPAYMDLSPVTMNGRMYLDWKIAATLRMNEPDQAQDHPPVLDMLIYPSDARALAQALILAADSAEDIERGGSGRPKHFPPPPPPPGR